MPYASVLACVLTFALLGCGSEAVEAPPIGHRVAGFDGRPVEVPKRPARIVPSTAAAASFVLALVGPERLAGLPEQVFAYSWSGRRLDPARFEGRLFGHFSAERMLELEPDLVISGALQSPEAALLLRRSGVASVTLPDLARFEDLIGAVEALGRILAAEAEASALAAELTERRGALAARLAAGDRRRVLTYSNLGTGGWTAGRGSTAELIVALSGHRSVAVEEGLEGYPPLDIEQLVELDPDVLVVGASAEDDAVSPTARYLRSESALATCRAVREDRIVVLPACLFSAGSHHVMDAAELLAAGIAALEGDGTAR